MCQTFTKVHNSFATSIHKQMSEFPRTYLTDILYLKNTCYSARPSFVRTFRLGLPSRCDKNTIRYRPEEELHLQ